MCPEVPSLREGARRVGHLPVLSPGAWRCRVCLHLSRHRKMPNRSHPDGWDLVEAPHTCWGWKKLVFGDSEGSFLYSLVPW